MQWFDEQAGMFLSDRYVEGTCPVCRFTEARGDQCERCGSYLNQMQLIHPRSKVTNSTPVARETTHWYLPLGEFQAELERWIGAKKDWKDNVINYCRGWFRQGLTDRAITRDLEWGVPVPERDRKGRVLEGAAGKVLYVWFEAVLGYISATKAWARHIGQPDRWKDYWLREDTKLVHFIGKDNIVFHAIVFPAITMAYNRGRQNERYVLVSEIPACEFLNLEGEKLSTSRNYAVWVRDYLDAFDPDPLRYALASILPENKDSDFSWRDFHARNNNELADILGNFVNRILTFTQRQFDGKVPAAHKPAGPDREMLDEVRKARTEVGEFIERFRIRDACRRFMDLARAANKHFNDSEPWKTVKTDRAACEASIHVGLQVVKALAVLMHPFLPFTSEKVWRMLGLPGSVAGQRWSAIGVELLAEGLVLGRPEIVFPKIEDGAIEMQTARLRAVLDTKEAREEPARAAPVLAAVSIDEFARLDLRAARVLEAEKIKGSDKLLKLQVDLGFEKRQIVSGLAQHYRPEELVGRQVIVVVNLKPARIRGVESQGMLLTVGDDEQLKVLIPEALVTEGSRVS
jgi:methionyl-tRNA synthetase